MVDDGRICGADVARVTDQIRALLSHSAVDMVICDAGAVRAVDLQTVDALARIQLAARRVGGEIQVCRAPPELRELLAVLGMAQVVPLRSV